MLRRLVVAIALVSLACGGKGSPVGPTPPPPPPPPALTGRILATAAGHPLGGLTLTVGGARTTSDGSGAFRLEADLAGQHTYTIDGAGIIPRAGRLVFGTRSVELDAIELDLDYYRAIARGRLDNAELQPLRRWQESPRLYLRTQDEAGREVDAVTLATVRSALGGLVETLTGGKLGIAELAEGAGTRLGEPGWVTIRWMGAPDPGGGCGQSDVAVSGGSIDLFWKDDRCRCGAARMRPRTIKHELGHALGLWHSSDPADLMAAIGNVCDQVPTEREVLAARVLYSRLPGNVDPDRDPDGVVLAKPARVR